MELTKKIGINVLRAEKRTGSNRIVIVIEPDLLSNQTFAVNPFYDEGDEKNKLQETNISLLINEVYGVITVKSCDYVGYHSTKGFRQIHAPITTHFFDRKSAAIDYIRNASNENEYYHGHIETLFKHWKEIDPDFFPDLELEYKLRIDKIKAKELKTAKANYHEALKELERCLENI